MIIKQDKNKQNDGSEYIAILKSYNQTMYLFKQLEGRCHNIEFVSTPCKIDDACSQSLLFKEECKQIVIDEIEKGKLDAKGIYKVIR